MKTWRPVTNYLGLVLACVAGMTLAVHAFPPDIDRGGLDSLGLGNTPEMDAAVARYEFCSSLGFHLLWLSFLLQIIAASHPACWWQRAVEMLRRTNWHALMNRGHG